MEEATDQQLKVGSPADEDKLPQPHVDVESKEILSYSASPKLLARRIQGGPGPPLCSSEPKEEEKNYLQDDCNTPQNEIQSQSSEPAQPDQPSHSTGGNAIDVPDDSTPHNSVESPALESDQQPQTDGALQGKEDPRLNQPIPLSETISTQGGDATSESSESTEGKPTQSNSQLQPDDTVHGGEDSSDDASPLNQPCPQSETVSTQRGDATAESSESSPSKPTQSSDPQSQPDDTMEGEEDSSLGKGTHTPPSANLNQHNPQFRSSTASDTKQGERVATSQDKVANLNASSPSMIMNGLQLKLHGTHNPFVSFTYALFPLMNKCVPVDWKLLFRDKVESVNIRCHELKPEDDLAELVLKFKKAYAKAVILINTQEDYSIAPHFLKGMEICNYPILVLTKEDGVKLLKVLDQYEDKVMARVDAESEVDAWLAVSGLSKEGSAGNGCGQKEKIAQKARKCSTVLSSELKKLLFIGEEAVVISKEIDHGRFTSIMSTFNNYEDEAKKGTNQLAVEEALHIIQLHWEKGFSENIPLYICIIYRIHMKRPLYNCSETKPFISICLEKIENLDHKEVAQVVNDFVERGDFHAKSGITSGKEESTSVFMILESACLVLSKLSLQYQQEKKNEPALYRTFCYSRMMWIALSLKFHHNGVPITKATRKIWCDEFIKYHHHIVMTEDVIQAVVKGIDLSRLLQLPIDLSFDWLHVHNLVACKDCLRPFKHLQNYVCAVEGFLNEIDLICFLNNVRSWYTFKLEPTPDFASMKSIKLGESRKGIIAEGINFLEALTQLLKRRQLEVASIDGHCTAWLHLLVGLVDIMGDESVCLLKMFKETKLLRIYQKAINDEILAATRICLERLVIPQFYELFKAFPRIWPNQDVENYFTHYSVGWNTKLLTDSTCTKEFIELIVKYFPGADKHYYLLNFLNKIGRSYQGCGHAEFFVLKLMQLGVPQLFADVIDVEEAERTREDFSTSLKDFIKDNDLRKTVFGQMKDLLEYSSIERDEFQLLILNVVQQEVLPEFKIIEKLRTKSGDSEEYFKNTLKMSVENLCTISDWGQPPSAKQTFCWGLVTSCCSRIHVDRDHFEWLYKYSYVIHELLKVFRHYCTGRSLSQEDIIIVNSLPDDVEMNPCNNVKKYFEWICDIQSMFKYWFDKLNIPSAAANYDDIMLYEEHSSALNALGHKVDNASVRLIKAETVKNKFLTEFEWLNVYLLRYIPQNPDAKWCTFPALLNEYGVVLPQTLFSTIQKYIVFPDKENTTGDELLVHPIPAGTNGQFQPGLEISLKLSKQFSLRDLSDLVQGLKQFQLPLIDQMGMLIFFKLNRSVMFDKYLRLQIRRVSKNEIANESSSETQLSVPMSGFSDSIPAYSLSQPVAKKKLTYNYDGVSVEDLSKSLENTQKLLHKIMNGDAAYSDIIAEGEIDLEKLNIEKEFTTLRNYFIKLPQSEENFEGLVGVRSLLELFQYTKHVQNIHGVCEQYQLEGCLHDPELKELQALVDKLESEEDRSRLTPNEASAKMKRVKELLIEHTSSHCLDVFVTVADSAEFYRFVQDKQFHGEEGQVHFHQQHQLITAQLQHQGYDESVLNHLLAAFKVITPFMNSKQSFKQLMTKVTSLDTTSGRKQLETVNGNITLIRLWFSRAEGDTLENVADLLETVLHTGRYLFNLPKNIKAQMLLEFIPSINKPSTKRIANGDASPVSDTVEPHSDMADSHDEQDAEMVVEERWNAEQIGDFVRKLGFIDTKKEEGMKIKHFRHISEIAYKLLKLYGQLKDLGNPRYFENAIDPLPCSIGREEADQRVQETEHTLTTWRSRVAVLRSQYDWLLFFSIPKLLRLFKLLSSREIDSGLQLDRIVHEICFLCNNDVLTRKELKKNVQSKLGNCLKDIESNDSPMHVVGKFLDLLFTNHKLPTRSDPSLPRLRFLTDFTQLLHYCPGYTQGQLIHMVIEICSGVPEAFEVFHCHPTTTEGELTLFLKRIAKHRLRSLVLEVNRLPFKLQENLMQLYLSFQQDFEIRTLTSPCFIHFIETAPSVLRDIPRIQLIQHEDPRVNFNTAKKVCESRTAVPNECVKLVYGAPGDGKTHYIMEKLHNSPVNLTIAVNEAFTPLKAISKLRSLSFDKQEVSIFFNFTMIPPGESVDKLERDRYQQLMGVIGWFFFDLLILGYVEDPVTGKSFRIPGGLHWAIYIEVPSKERNLSMDDRLTKDLELFCEEIPALKLLGTKHFIRPEKPYTVNDDVQLVCKYLQAFQNDEIDRLYRDPQVDKKHRLGPQPLVKFSLEKDLSSDQCQTLLRTHMPSHIHRRKITQRLFIMYMKRRCQFLDSLPTFNYNTGGGEYTTDEEGRKILTDTKQLGSTLMKAMLKEVSDFCDPDIKKKWRLKSHQQLIYDYKDHGASLGLVSLYPETLSESPEKKAFKRIGVQLLSKGELQSRSVLDDFLSRALNIQLENNRLTAIDDSDYVLTLDYTIKMLNIHERYECGVPVIIEGETGVGKTALIEMLSKLWNQSLLLEWKKQRDRIVELFVRKLEELPDEISDAYQACHQVVENLNTGKYCDVSEDMLLLFCQLPDSTHGSLHTIILRHLNRMRNDPVMGQLILEDSKLKEQVSLEKLFTDMDMNHTPCPELTAKLLHAVLLAKTRSTFHKINVHAAMTPNDIQKHVEPIIEQAKQLMLTYESYRQRQAKERPLVQESYLMSCDNSVHIKTDHKATTKWYLDCAIPAGKINTNEIIHRMPFVTVFFDEVNTSSCVGLFKEIIVDRTFDGTPIPANLFIVAACNPHRGNSMASLGVRGADEEKEKWVRGTYYVRKLHPTLRFLMWDYGSLDEHQEREYINAKMKMLNNEMSNPKVACLTDLIVESQKQMRQFAYEQIHKNLTGSLPSESQKDFYKISSRSCVSQRDVQRVFTFYQWFMEIYNKMKPYGDQPDYSRRAVLVALGIVYYMRLNNAYRARYSKFLDQPELRLRNEVTFTKAFEQELNWYIDKVELPKGIARTQALKENIFATIVCTVTHTPLIIVGAPGSAKTLSFNQTIANLKGAESRVGLFRDTSIFHSLDPHYYQCSRRTTSNEIQTVFSRAINRQKSLDDFQPTVYCVVFMDEAGLPEESHESLKVLHYHLDKQEVSFVAITNHVLDAAKTNRAVSLFRPEASNEDLRTLAKGCFCEDPNNPPSELQRDLDRVVQFCKPYSNLMERISFARFFGLRDFIQFVNYMRHQRDKNQDLTFQTTVIHALERNFNGSENFDEICSKFLHSIGHVGNVQHRAILDILRDSLKDRPQAKQVLGENEARYKLIIDPSEDDSLVRFLFSFGILNRDETRIFVCSNFPGDGQHQKINTISAIRHSAIEGHTVVMSQTDDIHESFYDLFNQHFRCINDPKEGPRYYTNIAIGAYSRPSRVHPNFQCVLVVKKSEVKNAPAPFLNRFEKYFISHNAFLETALEHMPPSMGSIVRAAMEKVQEFITLVSGSDSLYGFCPDTLNSLVLTLLPSMDHVYKKLGELSLVDDSNDVECYILQQSLQTLRKCSGFFIPKYTEEEFDLDVESVFDLIQKTPPMFGEVLTPSTAARAIQEAFEVLNSSKTGQLCTSAECNLVISLLQQWLVRHLCKRLMQLMTPEALILHRNKIPYTYLQNYLAFQTHFSLSDLVNNYHRKLKHTIGGDVHFCSSTKILCYTRSSPIIRHLPSEYPSSIQTAVESKLQGFLRDVVFDEVDKLIVCKVSHIVSQTEIQDLIRKFMQSETAEVCLLVVNMQETSKEIVNHVRILIEETETMSKQMAKIFFVLLHFPPAQLFHHCYPSLFLRGWDHYYLDTIANDAVEGGVNICDWFKLCCLPEQSVHLAQIDNILKALQEMLPQAVRNLASRIFFGSRHDGSFNSPMNGLQRTEVLELFLMKRKGDLTVWNLLCRKFRAYWKQSVIIELLQEAVDFNTKRESTLSITQSLQMRFNSLFFNFLVYMISQINENFNIDIIFDSDCTPDIEVLFLEILEVVPVPKLSQINHLSHQLSQTEPFDYTPRFPFFQLIYRVLEKVVQECKKAVNVELDIFDGGRSQISALNALHSAVTSMIKQKRKGFSSEAVQLAAKSIAKNEELWSRYFGEFIMYTFRLTSEEKSENIGYKILYRLFENQKLHKLEALERLVGLHCHVHVFQLDLTKMASRLRPLNELQKFHTVAVQTESMHALGSTKQLATFIISTFFDALVEINSPTFETESVKRKEKMIKWFKAYRDVMCLPDFKQKIYSSICEDSTESMTAMEARLNIVQMVFCVLQTSPKMDVAILKGQQTFQKLIIRYFDEKSLKLKENCPRIADVVHAASEVVSLTCSTLRHQPNCRVVGKLLEYLFGHFFSQVRHFFHPKDICWFLKLANQQGRWTVCPIGSPMETTHERPEIPGGAVSMNVFKLYLGRILGQCNQRSDTEAMKSGPLLLYHHSTRTEIGNVLSTSPDLGPPGPFIPKFYRECSSINFMPKNNARMQQPLAHLYFLTVLEQITSESHKIATLLRKFEEIHQQCTSLDTYDRDKVILWIELQAVTQVVAQQLALHLDPSKPEHQEVVSLLVEINKIMDDKSTGGGSGGGHGMVVTLHLYKLYNSSCQFRANFLRLYQAVFHDIKCLQPFHGQLKTTSEPSAHLFPFMLPNAKGDLATLYNQVLHAMKTIHNQGQGGTSLQVIAKQCDSSDRLNLFTMMIWLVSYYEFFDKKTSSRYLCNIVGEAEMHPYLKNGGYIRIIQCFLCPDRMLNCKEVPSVLPEGQAADKREEIEMDPLHDLFDPEKLEGQDQSDTELRHSLANMVAIVLGCPSHSNHLWYHIFAQNDLVNTYITGFMYDAKISPDGPLYDCGVELTAEGEIGRQDYNKHAGRGTYTLHSLYLLLWSNFGAFCMALLTQPDADTKIHGPIISKQQPIRHYCLSKVRSVWKCMTRNLGLYEEERTLFIRQCMLKLLQLPKTGTIVKDSLRGVFKTREELDSYEKMWHCCVYQPTWNELKAEFAEYPQLSQNNLFSKLRNLDLCYPHFPSETDFVSGILSHGELEQHSEGGELRLLSQFAQGWKRLKAGGLLLPDLVEFYQWLHTRLAHIVTCERTAAVSISNVVRLAAKRYEGSMGDYIVKLYERVKKGYNDYVHLIGGYITDVNKQQKKLEMITADTPLIRFLSVGGNDYGNDWLFTVITEIVNAHNMAIEDMYTVIQASDQSTLVRLLPERPAKMLPTEVNQHNCLIGISTSVHGISNLLQVIRSRYNPPTLSSTMVSHGPRLSFSLKQLEEDIILSFVAGKHLIDGLVSLRTPFVFKQGQMPTDCVLDKALHDTMNLKEVQKKLSDVFTNELPSDTKKRLECEFHSTNYDDLMKVITALKTVCDYLVKVANDSSPLAEEVEKKLLALTLPKFIIAHVHKHLTDSNRVLTEIGITPNSFKCSQLACLIKLPMPYVFSCLRQFMMWVDEGFYDFCSLPFTLKTHMTEGDRWFVKQNLRGQWTGSHGDLVIEVKKLITVLKHLEVDITKVEVESQKPIIECLKDYEMDGAKNELSRLIPKTILFQHFVDLRLTLRRLALELEREDSPQEATEESPDQGKWSEYVVDLHQRLPHLMEQEIYSEDFVYNLSTGRFGFQEGGEGEDSDDLEHDLSIDITLTKTPPSSSLSQKEERSSEAEWSQRSSGQEFEYEGAKVDVISDHDTAKTYTSERVGEFLIDIGLEKYRKSFVDQDIDGDTLLDSLLGETKHEFLKELGVEFALDRVRIDVMFLRELRKTQPRFPIHVLVAFLNEKKLKQYSVHFEQNEIDGDMLLAMEPNLLEIVLNDIGIQSRVAKQKIVSKLKTFPQV